MRGPSGAGKSTYVERNLPDALVCSADHFFYQEDGTYRFNRSKLGPAHETCKKKFKQALKDRVPLVVVDNTNTMIKEMKPYVMAAKHHGYRVECVHLKVPAEVAHGRNVHGVPFAAVKAMTGRMADVPEEWNETVIENSE
jgi:predicted kinase